MAYVVQKEGLVIRVHTCKIEKNMTIFPRRIVIDSQIYIITTVSGPCVHRTPLTRRINTKKRVSDTLLVPQEK
jgi:predicted metalloprotease